MSTPSLVTRFTRSLRELPFPAGAIYAVLLILGMLYAYIARSIAGTLPDNAWTLIDIYNAFSGPVILVAVLGFYHYFDQEIAEAADNSRSISGLSEPQFKRMKDQLITIPLWPHLIVGIIASLAAVQGAMFQEGFSRIELANIFVLIDWALVAAVTFGFAFRIIRLIVLIGRFYSGPIKLNLYNLHPVYELSTAVAKAGLFLLIIWYLNLPLNLNAFVLESPAVITTAIFVSLIPLAAFLIPQGILSRRLRRHKMDLSVDISLRLESVFVRIKCEVEAGNFEQIKLLQSAVETLISEKQYVASIPTWPWRLGTFRVTVTAVLLPVVVWLIQQLLDRILGL